MIQITRQNVDSTNAALMADITTLFTLCNWAVQSSPRVGGRTEFFGVGDSFAIKVTAQEEVDVTALEAAIGGATTLLQEGGNALTESSLWAVSNSEHGL